MPNPHFIPSSLLADANTLTVSTIILAGHAPTPSASGSDVYVNHWVIYLQITQGGSIRIDMSPNTTAGQLGTLIAKRLDYNLSSDVVHQIPFPAVQGLYARHVIDRITGKGYHQYRYGEKMLECRYWAYVVMKDFRDAGYIGGNGTEAYAAYTA
ncbi:hypothetical protein K458DRAFT_427118 [Lentithecium fluviatile CBS 122367]|uniref:DUF7770 domain-containing protein n=1 Tax=Lentithecium fluviatile CBS 122367 TaxID=1168545 RepID=A0A6G1JIR8_9PLEO|nr:hypothetical protein K458DRAFT_427118 [Lentithecium fluviatile CBS 122367]